MDLMIFVWCLVGFVVCFEKLNNDLNKIVWGCDIKGKVRYIDFGCYNVGKVIYRYVLWKFWWCMWFYSENCVILFVSWIN